MSRNYDNFADLITFSRASQSTVVDSDGTLKYAAHNLMPYSQAINDTNWYAPSLNATENAIVAPDGTQTATSFNLTSDGQALRTTSQVSLPESRMTNSFYFKAGNTPYFSMRAAFYTTNWLVGFDVNNLETITGIPSGGSASITDVGSNWYLCSVTWDASSPDLDGYFYYYFSNTQGSTSTDAGATGYLWGAHLYRSDKPMQNNPAQSDANLATYVPTTDAAVYQPRIDFDAVTGDRKGLLIEEARTNLDTNSETLEDWDFTQTSADSTSQESPDGLTNAVLLKEFASTSAHLCYFTITVTSGQPQTFSTFAKRNGRDLQLCFGSSDVTGNPYANFNLDSGEVSGTSGSITATIEDYGDGWFRCSATADAASNNSAFQVVLGLINTTNPARLPSYLGDGSSGVYIWGSQIENNASFPTSYIPTSGSTVTRSADVASIATSAFGFNEDEGTLFVDITVNSASVDSDAVVLSDGTNDNRLHISTGASNAVWNNFVITGGASQGAYNLGVSYPPPTSPKVSFGYQEDNCASSTSGRSVVSDTSVSLPTFNTLNFGSNLQGASKFINGHIKKLQYFPRRLSDTELQEITS